MKLVNKGDNGASDFGLIGRGIEISGDISFTDRLQIEGRVSGTLTSESGTLGIGETGQVEARVEVGVCIIHGTLEGDLVASSRVEIRRTGRVTGDVITPVLLVEEGAIFNGAIRMGKEAAAHRFEEVRSAAGDSEEHRRVKEA
ncbi:MAG TPA: polymer-forming cytoskeletal protein [Blastocatellia bacterium]|nr:polymer-forming cytoskeletal protein [Blastocatellia bacterium]